MTDEAYVFHEDSKEKKRAARSAHKKPVRNSRKCRFPSDYKTPKELKKMNSEVVNYNLSQPMKWAEFCAMPEDLQKQYLISLRGKYNTTIGCLGGMFGVTRQTVANKFAALGLESPAKGTRHYPEWDSFIRHDTPARVDETAEPDIPEPAAHPVGCVLTANDAMMLSNVHGILCVLAATGSNASTAKLLCGLADDVQRLVKAWMEVQV